MVNSKLITWEVGDVQEACSKNDNSCLIISNFQCRMEYFLSSLELSSVRKRGDGKYFKHFKKVRCLWRMKEKLSANMPPPYDMFSNWVCALWIGTDEWYEALVIRCTRARYNPLKESKFQYSIVMEQKKHRISSRLCVDYSYLLLLSNAAQSSLLWSNQRLSYWSCAAFF